MALHRPGTRAVAILLIVGMLGSIVLATLVSFYASSAPDGLEKVAQQTGFADEEKSSATADSPLAGYEVSGVLEQSVVGRLATTRLVPPGLKGSGVVVDLLFASSGIEPEVVEAAEHILILKDVSAPVATIGHLIALKLLSEGKRRPHDAADLVALSKAASPFDFAQARSAVRLIAERGYNRGRDLETALSALIGSQLAESK